MVDNATRSPSTGESTGRIKDQTRGIGESVVDAGGDVVQSAKEQGGQVVAETGRQARRLYGQARAEMTDQARVQQKRAVDGLYAVADEAARIADQGGESGPVTQAVREASGQIKRAGQWLENREPGSVLDEVKMYARRHPATFLVGAALLGVIAGRFVKNAVSEAPEGAGPTSAPEVGALDTSNSIHGPVTGVSAAAPTLAEPWSENAYPTGQVRS
jgi:hypothetical protein